MKNSTSTRRDRAARGNTGECGVSVVQFVIVVPLLMLITIALVDFSRLLTIQTLLNKGAEEGLNVAMKLSNIDNDIRNLNVTDPEYQYFIEARRRVAAAATRVPLSTLLTDENTPSAAQLLPLTITDDTINAGGSPPSYTYGAALIRPAESVLNNTTGSTIQHAKLADPGSVPPPQKTQTLLTYLPMQVELQARVQMLLPWLGTKDVSGIAYGFREPGIPDGPLAPVAGQPAFNIVTTTTSTTSTTTSRTTTTLVMGCNISWNLAVSGSITIPNTAGRLPAPASLRPPILGTCQNQSSIVVIPYVSNPS